MSAGLFSLLDLQNSTKKTNKTDWSSMSVSAFIVDSSLTVHKNITWIVKSGGH